MTAAIRRRIRARCAGLVGERGAVLIEFILVFPILLLLLMGIIEFGWWIHVNNVVDQSARAGARRIAIDGAVSSQAAKASAAVVTGSGLKPAQARLVATVGAWKSPTVTAVNPSWTTHCVKASYFSRDTEPPLIGMTVTYKYKALFPVLSSPLFFGGINALVSDITTSVRLPSETVWVSGKGPLINGKLYLCP